mmetsp:Transcript_11135/g.24816  ORF Transcript_11135/g.24816 Transcript_11135/m.24816 type:complete len:274 (-) Transcript_11135:1594-2415(-)
MVVALSTAVSGPQNNFCNNIKLATLTDHRHANQVNESHQYKGTQQESNDIWPRILSNGDSSKQDTDKHNHHHVTKLSGNMSQKFAIASQGTQYGGIGNGRYMITSNTARQNTRCCGVKDGGVATGRVIGWNQDKGEQNGHGSPTRSSCQGHEKTDDKGNSGKHFGLDPIDDPSCKQAIGANICHHGAHRPGQSQNNKSREDLAHSMKERIKVLLKIHQGSRVVIGVIIVGLCVERKVLDHLHCRPHRLAILDKLQNIKEECQNGGGHGPPEQG